MCSQRIVVSVSRMWNCNTHLMCFISFLSLALCVVFFRYFIITYVFFFTLWEIFPRKHAKESVVTAQAHWSRFAAVQRVTYLLLILICLFSLSLARDRIFFLPIRSTNVTLTLCNNQFFSQLLHASCLGFLVSSTSVSIRSNLEHANCPCDGAERHIHIFIMWRPKVVFAWIFC